jgi:hypothetical protein
MRDAGFRRRPGKLIVGWLLICASIALAGPHWPAKPNRILAAYQKRVTDIIGPRWYACTEAQRDRVALGKVTVTFRILSDGQVANLKIIGNTSNEVLLDCAISAILDARFPPIPDGVCQQIHQDFIDWDNMNFIMYPN